MTDQKKRREAHEALNRLLDAEELIKNSSDPDEREGIAWEHFQDFKLYMRFPILEKYAMFVNAPATVTADDPEIGVEDKRDMIAGAITWGIPLSDGDALELGEALCALNLGQTMEILKPNPISKREMALQIQHLQLLAVMGSYFLHGTGIGIGKARKMVAECYGLPSGENIRIWEQRDLVGSLGKAGIERVLYMTKIALISGELFKSDAPHPPGTIIVFGTTENTIRSMKECGEAYRAALKKEEIEIPKIYFA